MNVRKIGSGVVFFINATGVEGVIEIESQWTARKRELKGIMPVVLQDQNPRSCLAENARQERGTRKAGKSRKANVKVRFDVNGAESVGAASARKHQIHLS